MQPVVATRARRSPLGRVFYDTLIGYLRDLSPPSRRFWFLVPLTGVIAGVAAASMAHVLHALEAIAWSRDADLLKAVERASALRRVLLPCLAGLLVTGVCYFHRGGSEGHGTAHILEAIWVRRGRVSLSWALVRGALCIVVVALGASLGREGALIYFGAASGSWLGRRFRVTPDQLKMLVACGAASGISAAYNTPIGGAIFGLEVFLGGLALEMLGPIIFSTVTATLLSRMLLSDHPSYSIPHFRLHHPAEIALYLVLGILVGVLSALFVRTVEASARLSSQIQPRFRPLMPIGALALVGVVGIWFPHVYGNGYDTVNLALTGKLTLFLACVLPLIKMGLTSLCAASGAPGGLFTPTLFVGALAGEVFGLGVHRLAPELAPTVGGYVLVGMAAILAGSTHATLAAPLLLFEMTGSYDLILPLLAASVVSTVVSRSITRESIYTAPLSRRGVQLPRIDRPAWMQREGLRHLVRADALFVTPSTPLSDLLIMMARGVNELYVVAPDQRLVGVIDLETVREALFSDLRLEWIIAADLMTKPSAIPIDASLWDATRRALATELVRLPVVERDSGRFVGTLAVPEVLAAARRQEPQSSSSSGRR